MNDCVHRPLICRMLYKLLTYRKNCFTKTTVSQVSGSTNIMCHLLEKFNRSDVI